MKYSPNQKDIKAESDILETMKTFLGITDDSKDTLLKAHLGATCQLIRNYTNMCPCDSVPEELYYLWAEMAAKRYALATSSFSKGDSGEVEVKGRVNSVTDGSQSVSYGYGDISGAFVSTEADKALISGFASQLDRYRQIRWN